MGASDAESEGIWLWRSDSTQMSLNSSINSSILSWIPGEPNTNFDSNCLLWDPAFNLYQDDNCANSRYYICEHPRQFNISMSSILPCQLVLNRFQIFLNCIAEHTLTWNVVGCFDPTSQLLAGMQEFVPGQVLIFPAVNSAVFFIRCQSGFNWPTGITVTNITCKSYKWNSFPYICMSMRDNSEFIDPYRIFIFNSDL